MSKPGMPFLGRKNLEPFPWDLIEPHRKQADLNHGQTLERIKDRGGLTPAEMLAVLEDREWRKMNDAEALGRLAAIVSAARAPS